MKTRIYHPIEADRIRMGEIAVYSEGICADASPWITSLATSSAQASRWRHCHLDCYEDAIGKKRIFSIAYGSANGNFSLNPSHPHSSKRNYFQFCNLLFEGDKIFYPHNYERINEFVAISFCEKNAMDGLTPESFELRLVSGSKVFHVRDFWFDENKKIGIISSGSLINSTAQFNSSSAAYGLIFYAQGIALLDFQKINSFFDNGLTLGISQNYSLNERFFELIKNSVEEQTRYFQHQSLKISDPFRYETDNPNNFIFEQYGDGVLSTSFNLTNNLIAINPANPPASYVLATAYFSNWKSSDVGHAFLIEGSIRRNGIATNENEKFYFSLSGSGCGINFSTLPEYVDKSSDFEITNEWKRFFCVQVANAGPTNINNRLEFTFKIRGENAIADPYAETEIFYLKDLKAFKIFSQGKLPDKRFFARRDRIERFARIFLRVSNEKCNFSLNPTFLNGDELKNEEFYNHPIVYPTMVGLCDDDGNVLAVGKFSKPIQKSFLREIILDLNIST